MSDSETADDIYRKYLKYKNKYFDLVKKRLNKSLYPHQRRDFFFLIIPDGYPDAGREIPVDYLLRNLVVYFWNKGLITKGWDQGDWMQAGFITFSEKTIKNEDTLKFLRDLLYDKFGRNNVVVYDNRYNVWKTKEDAIAGVKYNKENTHLFFDIHPEKLRINAEVNYIAINFKNSYLPKIYEKLGLDFYPFNERCPGALIPYVVDKSSERSDEISNE